MIRRKGTYEPCDPCCRSRDGIRTINGQYPDANREFRINAGEGVSIDPDGNGIRIGIRLASPMVFRGTVGTGGTIASLPTANADNLGWTYVAVSSGSTPDTPPKSYETGDMLISNSVEWTVVPAGDDPVDWSQITGKPTTLAGYGITDAVTLNTVQDITGKKTMKANGGTMLEMSSPTAYSTGDAYSSFLDFIPDLNGPSIGRLYAKRNASEGVLVADIRRPDNTWMGSVALYTDGTSSWMTGPTRTYSASNVNDIVTIGSLASNPNVVHTVGNETVAGNKSWRDSQTIINPNITNVSFVPPNNTYRRITVKADNGDEMFILEFRNDASNTRSIRAGIYNPTSSQWVWTTLASVTP